MQTVHICSGKKRNICRRWIIIILEKYSVKVIMMIGNSNSKHNLCRAYTPCPEKKVSLIF